MALHTLAFQQAFIRGIQLEATKLNHETKPDNELSYEVQLKIIELRVIRPTFCVRSLIRKIFIFAKYETTQIYRIKSVL